ncbi:MAG: hypothetical protein AB7F59_08440 [Bdellovibrionales bacterium]
MSKSDVRCPNMNHGRMNVNIKYCPSCGESMNPSAPGSCNAHTHADLLKNRYIYCTNCGKKLA